MKWIVLFTVWMLWSGAMNAQHPRATTYSVVAIDSITGDMGVAVQSHWFAVGTVVPWGEAGVGVVATQSMANPNYGPHGLDLMREGYNPEEAIDILTKADHGSAFRQVALLDASGRVSVHTGDSCIGIAGHEIGRGFSVQANLMPDRSVLEAMFSGYKESEGQSLAKRLLAALEAGERAGGDIRGKQSAALLVVRGESTGSKFEDRLVDLRVDDHRRPLQELRRLYTVERAYDWLSRGDRAIESGNYEMAQSAYQKATQMYPSNMELRAWTTVGWLNAGKDERAADIFRIVLKEKPVWADILMRLQDVGLIIRSKESLKQWLDQFE